MPSQCPSASRSAPEVLEIFYTALLAVAFIAVVWFSGLVVYKLFKGQS
ncbi:hypothetical protein LI90_4106 [Carbonactinospora thermoautotrophica]|uniref:Uncharacterized protein n=1 Tax=Carbonactinospora thermoautotrophica TaxID=1469144 RepID=A0A132MZA2_9ACTN|nr:hypothetical protein LI90_4106 [Carbonactinospora thermoautotrophica]